jgi:hypothetical protein
MRHETRFKIDDDNFCVEMDSDELHALAYELFAASGYKEGTIVVTGYGGTLTIIVGDEGVEADPPKEVLLAKVAVCEAGVIPLEDLLVAVNASMWGGEFEESIDSVLKGEITHDDFFQLVYRFLEG